MQIGLNQKYLKGSIVFLGLVFPILLTLVTIPVSFHRAKSVQFCSSCHTMTPFVNSLKQPEKEGLSAKHYQRGWVHQNACATCHADYGFLGPLDSKVRGFRHLLAYYVSPEKKEKPKLYQPFPNQNCLHCHGDLERFQTNPPHLDMMAQIRSGDVSCLMCHAPAHVFNEGEPQ